MSKKSILVTGANGFIGRALLRTLLESNKSVSILTHSISSAEKLRREVPGCFAIYCTQEVEESNLWEKVFFDIDTVIHCGAQTKPVDDIQLIQSNYKATMALAIQAVKYKARRFIFLSSMSVFGDMKQTAAFTEQTPLNPITVYGKSKLYAEEGLRSLANKIELVIIRPPLVYGPRVSNNFKKLFALVDKGLPLPLGAVKNKRHFIGINNLIHFIITCIWAKEATNEAFIVADQEALSTTELIRQISKAMNRKSWLIPIPSKSLEFLLKCIGMAKLSEQILYNIEIDCTKAKTLLNWKPPYSFQEELQLSVNYYLAEQSTG